MITRYKRVKSAPFLRGFDELRIPVLDNATRPTWPERFSLEKIKEIRIRSGNRKFSSQMLLQPVTLSEGILNPNHFNIYQNDLRYIESNGKFKLYLGDIELTHVNCFWDPAFGKTGRDNSVLAIIFWDALGKMYIQEVIYLKVHNTNDSAHEQCTQVLEIMEKNFVTHIHIETNGIGAFLVEFMRKYSQEKGQMITIQPWHQKQKKSERILDAFDAPLHAGFLLLHQSVTQTFFLQEMEEFSPENVNGKDDGLDAVAGAILTPNKPIPTRHPNNKVKQSAYTVDTSGFKV